MRELTYVTAADLAAYDLTVEDVRRRCPWAVEYTALDGRPCWRREGLTPLLGESDRRDWP